ncbi:helix-turn-helix domain-containing protein [Pseudomonas sp. FP818]|uniref:helix-turn-helix domain-containing protein n=2 Tax=Pseudomonas TaxID=286 RepID=UPI0027334833|nr:helix-turn-helix domain-containing protein [Pseudomonas sp. FP818]WLI37278.1 transcriptional regulator [Pseudomonas sp. FP818]
MRARFYAVESEFLPRHDALRQRLLSQESLAKALDINQAAVSKMERRTDRYISTLRNYIRATFPDGQVKIDNFAN